MAKRSILGRREERYWQIHLYFQLEVSVATELSLRERNNTKNQQPFETQATIKLARIPTKLPNSHIEGLNPLT